MSKFNVPTAAEVSSANQEIFSNLKSNLGFVPNLYAYYAKNETALADYLQFQNRKSTLSKKEIEVVNLVVSEHNGCHYCTSAHTALGELNGFSKNEILEIRSGQLQSDSKLNALANFALQVAQQKGKVSNEVKNSFLEAGYSESNLIDVVLKIGDKVISNYVHNIAGFEIDFPKAQPINQEAPAQ